MNYNYLLIKGPLGVGKTTTALYLTRQLREEGHNCSDLSFDHFYKSFFDLYFSEEKVMETGKLVLPLIEQLREIGYFCIIEGVFLRPVYEYVRLNLSGRLLDVTLNAPLEVCLLRNAEREKDKKLAEKRVTRTWHTTQDGLSGIVLDSQLSTEDLSNHLYQMIVNPSDS